MKALPTQMKSTKADSLPSERIQAIGCIAMTITLIISLTVLYSTYHNLLVA